MKAQVGDRLIVRGRRVQEPDRDARILEVRGPNGSPPYLIRWSDSDHDTLFYPGPGALIEHPQRPPIPATIEALGRPARRATGSPTLTADQAVDLIRRHIDLEKVRTFDYDADLWALWEREVEAAAADDVNGVILDRVLEHVRQGE